ncbi:hypothetical protein [Tessaracoccus sp.]
MNVPSVTNTPDPTTTTRPHQPLKHHRHPQLKIVAWVLVLLMIIPGISYAQALTAPGYATWQDRSVGWVRDNGGAPLVDAIENWWYTRHPPADTAPPLSSLPNQARQFGSAKRPPTSNPNATGSAPVAVPALVGVNPLPGEGNWSVDATGKDGKPVLYTTFLRPDPGRASVVAGAAWIPAGSTSAHLVPGTAQPVGWSGSAAIPASDMSSLVATFNSGWKFKDTGGGFFLHGREQPALRDGFASVVINTEGQVTVGQWGRDVSMGPDVVAVRQNLHLIVEAGAPVAGLESNGNGAWGSAKNQLQFTWRSGLGTDAAGDLIYVAGDNLTLQTLATAMSDAGIQTGMQLDIHDKKVNFATWTHTAGRPAVATNLLPDMTASPTRYVAADQRDFFYLTLN